MPGPCLEMAENLSPDFSDESGAGAAGIRLGGTAEAAVATRAWVWLNQFMFARKIRVEYEADGRKLSCPLKWLDSFSMRNFTNASVFDDTLPLADGQMEIGSSVPLDQLRDAMEEWFQRKGYMSKESHLSLTVN